MHSLSFNNLENVVIDSKETLAIVDNATDGDSIAGYLIELCDKHNLMDGDWKARLEDLDLDREKVTWLKGSCPALTEADNKFKCVWGVDGKPPAIKVLSKDHLEALEMCAACKTTLEIKLENQSYQVKVQELEAKLQEQSTKKFKIPQCNNGGRLDGDGLAFEGCPRSPGKVVSIEGYCKKLKNGAGCDWFKSRLVGVSSEA